MGRKEYGGNYGKVSAQFMVQKNKKVLLKMNMKPYGNKTYQVTRKRPIDFLRWLGRKSKCKAVWKWMTPRQRKLRARKAKKSSRKKKSLLADFDDEDDDD